jgi:transposase
LTEKLNQANSEIEKFKDILSKNSSNSSKPSSTDGFNRPSPKSQRVKGLNPVGGQLGHEGSTLLMSENPDKIIIHRVNECIICKEDISYYISDNYRRRQVIDLLENNKFITEHQIQITTCGCGCENKAKFPDGVNAPTQYGPKIKATIVYLNKRQLIPYLRTSETVGDLFNMHMSAGTIVSMTKETSEKLKGTEKKIKAAVLASDTVHFDESGMQINGDRHWVHVAVTNVVSYFMSHIKRGKEAMNDMGILPQYCGNAIHDHWKSYFSYTKSTHFLCNAHHLRELEFIHERYEHLWAKDMKDLLKEIKKRVDELKTGNISGLSETEIEDFEQRYQKIIKEGYLEDPAIMIDPKLPKKPGPVAQSKGRNLLDRLFVYEQSVLGFMRDFNIPFDNNQAERDVRMLKVHQKISGSFRSEQGPIDYCRIMSYISTIRKNSINVIEAISSVFSGTPIFPNLNTS